VVGADPELASPVLNYLEVVTMLLRVRSRILTVGMRITMATIAVCGMVRTTQFLMKTMIWMAARH
jgi:hypothetical protein